MKIAVVGGALLLTVACSASGRPSTLPSRSASPTPQPTASRSAPIVDDTDPYRPADSGYDMVFKSPSGNIECFLGSANDHATVDCEIKAHSWHAAPCPPPRVAGVSLYAGNDKPTVGCLAWSEGNLHTLRYGHALNDMQITCVSRSTGISCSNGLHGFEASRESYSSF